MEHNKSLVKYCPKCGNKISADANFCPYCGAVILMPQPCDTRKRKLKTPLLVGMITILVLVVIFIGYKVFGDNDVAVRDEASPVYPVSPVQEEKRYPALSDNSGNNSADSGGSSNDADNDSGNNSIDSGSSSNDADNGSNDADISDEALYSSCHYDCDGYSLDLPPSWSGRWTSVEDGEYRSSMDAKNWCTHFYLDGVEMFNVQKRSFNIGAFPESQVDNDPSQIFITGYLSPEDRLYIRQSLVFYDVY